MSHSRRGNGLAAAAVGIGAGVVTFTLHRTMHDGADEAGSGRPVAMIAASDPRHDEGREASANALDVAAPPSRGRDVAGSEPRAAAGTDPEPGAARARSRAEPDASAAPPRSPHADALRHPSEGFRNTSLLALVRDAGHVCLDIVAVSSAAWAEAGAAWRVSCDGARAYIVFEVDGGEFLVEPLEHFDGPAPRPATTPFDRSPRPDHVIPLDELQ